jgi:hypothetical protein
MRTKYEDQELTQDIAAASLGDGVSSIELDLPNIEAGDAIIVRRVFIGFLDGTDVPAHPV